MCTQGSTCHETDGRSRQQQDFHLTHNSRHPCYYGKYTWQPSPRFIHQICHSTYQVVTRWSPGCFLIETTGCFTFTCGCCKWHLDAQRCENIDRLSTRSNPIQLLTNPPGGCQFSSKPTGSFRPFFAFYFQFVIVKICFQLQLNVKSSIFWNFRIWYILKLRNDPQTAYKM